MDSLSTFRLMENETLYEPRFVRSLFDEMATTYGIVNLLSSFGFTFWWRRSCAREIPVESKSIVLDLMSGMGELCVELSRRYELEGELIALDFSSAMCSRAKTHQFEHDYRVIEADALSCPLPNASVDYVFSTFGLKTFSDNQLTTLATEVSRLLRPGGQFAFLEISVPPNTLLRLPYMFYLNHVVPVIGRLLLGNPENYRLLGVYTAAFGNCEGACKIFSECGLSVELKSYFFGCATGIVGHRSTQRSG